MPICWCHTTETCGHDSVCWECGGAASGLFVAVKYHPNLSGNARSELQAGADGDLIRLAMSAHPANPLVIKHGTQALGPPSCTVTYGAKLMIGMQIFFRGGFVPFLAYYWSQPHSVWEKYAPRQRQSYKTRQAHARRSRCHNIIVT